MEIQNFESGILITSEMQMGIQNVIESEVNENIITEDKAKQSEGEENRYMNFNQAFENLKNGEILTRKAWVNKMIKTNNNQFVIWSNNPFDRSTTYNCTDEDIFAEDWELVDPDDIKEFYLSVNQLKALKVSNEAIDELKNQLPKRLIDLCNSELIIDPDKLKEFISNPPNLLYTYTQNIKTPEIIKK